MCPLTLGSASCLVQRDKECRTLYSVWLSRKRNEDEEPLYELYRLVTYKPVTTFENLQTVNVD